uniref:Uncharacterized protein n=1 Tax=viral metagenome TaxID=1070528 RepID=A0A6C0IB50_9ZZZZ
MKIKLKDFDFKEIKYSLNKGIFTGKLVNFSYLGNNIEFQTPKVIIHDLVTENDKQYILLKLIGTEASKTFYNKIIQLENSFNSGLKTEWFNKNLPVYNVTSIFSEDNFLVKVLFKGSSPQIKVYNSTNLFNYYHLKPGMKVICLVACNNIWINFDNVPSYNLTVKEIMVTDESI